MIMHYLRLYFEFFKTGLFSVGGGMATFPFLYEMATRTGWFTHEQLADMIAVSESTPGPIGVNMATYVGYTTGGIPGAVIATLGLATPSVIVILLIARVLKAFRQSPYVDSAFYGLRPCSIGLISAAGALVLKISMLNIDLFKESGKIFDLINIKAVILAAILVYLTRYCKKTKGFHPIVFIAFAAAVGIVFSF